MKTPVVFDIMNGMDVAVYGSRNEISRGNI